MRKLFTTFDDDSCFDLNALVHELRKEFELPLGQDAKPCLFHAISKIAETVSQPGSVPEIMLAGKLDAEKMKEEYLAHVGDLTAAIEMRCCFTLHASVLLLMRSCQGW